MRRISSGGTFGGGTGQAQKAEDFSFADKWRSKTSCSLCGNAATAFSTSAKVLITVKRTSNSYLLQLAKGRKDFESTLGKSDAFDRNPPTVLVAFNDNYPESFRGPPFFVFLVNVALVV